MPKAKAVEDSVEVVAEDLAVGAEAVSEEEGVASVVVGVVAAVVIEEVFAVAEEEAEGTTLTIN
eukprot:CAMPEP_0195251014 /NCGR_PEP_ID=MMETSP0706-20130129/3032_1 /TAXON_ID=33640 /ORGANISM="Asterionellopsis glacialis, Strain CCMP134" /LENGTH=63 /DNA_ID=CAMNT_0040303073 /DNA_START=404 /DNA_END=595 /DNA_ORIENTATION=-